MLAGAKGVNNKHILYNHRILADTHILVLVAKADVLRQPDNDSDTAQKDPGQLLLLKSLLRIKRRFRRRLCVSVIPVLDIRSQVESQGNSDIATNTISAVCVRKV